MPSDALVIILDTFLHYISELHDFKLIKEVTQNVFWNNLYQSPELDIFEAESGTWRKVSTQKNMY